MASSYWEQRILADERRATEIAQRASEEMAKMYRAQYLRVVKEIDKLKAQIDYGKPLTRTQLWNYARWSKVEESLKGFVTEAVTIDTQVIHDAINAEFERVIGKPAADYGGALGRRGTISMTRSETPWVSESDKVGLPRLKSKISGAAPGLEKNRILSGDWSGEHYSARVWKNTSAIADRMRNEITNMLVDGKSTQDIRRAVMREFGVGYKNADLLVRTEVSYVHNQMTLARYKEDGDTLVKILIVEDGKACEVCQELPGKPYDINAAPFLPAHPRCRCCYAPWTYSDRKRWVEEHPEEAVSNHPEEPESSAAPPKTLQTPAGDDILDVLGTKAGGDGVQALCKIENQIYRCIAGDLMTDEVIITDKQAAHSNEDHSNVYEKYGSEIPKILADPDLIFEDKRPFSGLVVGKINIEGRNLAIALRIRVASDPEDYKNSVITCWDIGEDRLKIYRRNRKILYKRPEL